MALICSNTCWGKERACAITTSLIAVPYLSLPLSQAAFSGLSSAVKNDSAANRLETQNEIEFKSTAGTWTVGTKDHKVIAVRQRMFMYSVWEAHLACQSSPRISLSGVCVLYNRCPSFQPVKIPKSVWSFFFFYGQKKKKKFPAANIYLLELPLPTQWKMDFHILYDK